MTRRSQHLRPRRPRRWFLAAILGLTAAAATWRFASQSLSATSLVPYVESALERAAPGVDLEIDRIELRWGGWRRGIDLALQGIVVHTGGARLDVAEVLLKFSLRALLHGHLAPAQIEVVHPSGKLIRDVDGKIRLLAIGSDGEQPVRGSVFERLLDDLASEDDAGRPLTFLRSVRVSDAELVLQDRVYGVDWRASGFDLDLYPAGTDIAGELRAEVHVDEHTAHVEGRLAYDGPTRVFDCRLEIDDLPTETVVRRIASLPDRLRISSNAAAQVGIALDLDGALQRFDVDLVVTPGELVVPGWLDKAEPFRTMRLAGGFVGAGGWQLGPLVLELGTDAVPGLRFELDGSVANPDDAGARAVQARLRLPQLQVKQFEHYWPPAHDLGSRKWVLQHVTRGSIRDLEVKAALRFVGTEKALHVDRIAGEFELEDVAVRWHDHAPPVTGLNGRARFDRTSMRFAIDSGRVRDLELAAGSIDLPHLDRKPGRLEIHLEGAGPVADAVEAIDLHLPAFLGTTESGSDTDISRIAFQADVGFFMKKGVRLPDLEIDVDAQVDSLRLDSDLAQGLVSGRLRFTSPGSPQRLLGEIDLQQVTSELGVLGWQKPVGAAATARFELLFAGGKARTIEQFDVQADGLRMAGTARFRSNGDGIERLDLNSLRSGRTHLEHARLEWMDSGLHVDLARGDIDLAPLRQKPGALAPSRERPHLEVHASAIDRLYLNEDGWLAQAAGGMRREGGDWLELEVSATVPSELASPRGPTAPAVRLHLQPGATPGLLDLRVSSEDFGGLARAMRWSQDLIGGSLIVRGSDLGRRFERGKLRVEAADFSVGDAPIAVRLLSLASFESMVNLLQTSDLHFDELAGDLELEGERLIVHEVRGHGSSLGWLARGSIDLGDSSIDLGGTMIPAYAANRFLNAVPVLREVLVGEGILSVDYRIRGTLAEPEIDTNPMSAITPEALRDIFDPGRDRR